MTPRRRDCLLSGQSQIAQKVYQAVTANQTISNSVLDVATKIKAATGTGVDIHTLRGCLAGLEKAGLVREVVRGSFRQVEVKEKKDMVVKHDAVVESPNSPGGAPERGGKEIIDVLGGIASRLRVLADDIDTAALAVEEQRACHAKELEKLSQLKSILKSLG